MKSKESLAAGRAPRMPKLLPSSKHPLSPARFCTSIKLHYGIPPAAAICSSLLIFSGMVLVILDRKTPIEYDFSRREPRSKKQSPSENHCDKSLALKAKRSVQRRSGNGALSTKDARFGP